jgi:iron complex transport system ATP-binding protein
VSLLARHLSLSYGRQTVLHGIDLALQPGQLVALVGPNGSGKSSLIKCLAGLLPHSGQVSLSDQPLSAAQIGYMPQDHAASDALTVLETVLLGRLGQLRWQVGDGDLAAVEAVLTRLGIGDLAQRWLGDLSGGQRQLVFLAQSLVAQPRVLLLDEPISALDLRHQLEVMDTVRELTLERGLVTLAVLHDLNAAVRHADEVVLLHEGRILEAGPPAQVLTASHVRRVFQVDVCLLAQPGGAAWIAPMGVSAPRRAWPANC